MKMINVGTKFRWKISKNDDNYYVAVCDRLNLTTQAVTMNDLLLQIQDAQSLLFSDLWKRGGFNKFTFDHSMDFKVDDYTDYVDVTPNPLIIVPIKQN